MENNKTTNNLNKSSSILRILGLLLILISFSIFIYNTRKQENNIEIINSEIIKKDSIITKIEIQLNREDSLKSIIKDYLKFRKYHDVDELDKFYSETVISYFINLQNCKKEDIKISDGKYWAKYKKDSFVEESEPEIIFNNNLAKAIIKGKHCKTEVNCIDVIMVLKFNSKNKINYVRAYYSN